MSSDFGLYDMLSLSLCCSIQEPQHGGREEVVEMSSDIVCHNSVAYEVMARKPVRIGQDVLILKQLINIVCFELQKPHKESQNTSDILCFKSPAYEAVSCKPPVYDYVSLSDVHPKPSLGGSDYTELGPHPLDAPPILSVRGGKKVLSSDIKHTVSSTELAYDT